MGKELVNPPHSTAALTFVAVSPRSPANLAIARALFSCGGALADVLTGWYIRTPVTPIVLQRMGISDDAILRLRNPIDLGGVVRDSVVSDTPKNRIHRFAHGG